MPLAYCYYYIFVACGNPLYACAHRRGTVEAIIDQIGRLLVQILFLGRVEDKNLSWLLSLITGARVNFVTFPTLEAEAQILQVLME